MKPTPQKPILEIVIADFHCGWLIEVYQLEGGYQSWCTSPNGYQLSDRNFYAQPLQAQQAAIQLIDRLCVSFAIKQALREQFEANKLSFDEWQALTNSLH